jgi:hypothetical protein
MAKLDPQLLDVAISRLRNLARAAVPDDQRARYRELIKERRLFRHDEALGNLAVELRKTLLKIAFDPPLGYEDYCLIEDGIDEAAIPDPALLQLIEKAGLTDNRVKAIVYRQLPAAEAEKKLTRWYASKEVSADRLLNLLALEVQRPRHTQLLCNVTIDYLGKMSQRYDSKEIDRVLRQHSYLARKLQDSMPGQNQYQIETLGYFLSAAYPDGLTRPDIYHIMIGTKDPLTLPFLAAVHLMVTNPSDAFLARELYVYYSFLAMGLDTATNRELVRLISADVQVPKTSAPQSSNDDPAEDSAQPNDENLPLPEDSASSLKAIARLNAGPW